MKVDVYDTYATNRDGATMHFDVLIPTGRTATEAFQFAQQWLTAVGHGDATLTQSRCTFCHAKDASPAAARSVEDDGFHIFRISGCPRP